MALTDVTSVSDHTLYAVWVANESLDWRAALGTAFDLTLSDAFAGSAKVTVSGLPAGLKFDAATRTIEGVPTKTGGFEVTLSVAGGETRAFTINVEALPTWAWGAFNGYVVGGGMATMTVTAAGKITGKIAIAGSNYAFTASSYTFSNDTDGFAVSVTAQAGKASLPLNLTVVAATNGVATALGIAEGTIGDGLSVVLYRNVWKDAGMTEKATSYIGYYTATLLGSADYGSGYLTFTVDDKGNVKTAGKLADGTAVSLSGTLVLDEGGGCFTVLHTAPTAYKGGIFFGLAEFLKSEDGGVYLRLLDGLPFVWQNLSPQATGDYGLGFSRAPGLTGGLYDKKNNLKEYYSGGLTVSVSWTPPALLAKVKYTDFDPESEKETPPKISWTEETEASDAGVSPSGLALTLNAAGTAISAPKSPAPSKLIDSETREFLGYNYDELENPSGLTFTFAKATGLFKGSFNVYYDYVSAQDNTKEENGVTWTHVVKKVSFQGALTPVREDSSDGAEGGGFFLWADQGSYENAAGKTLSYPFNWSYDFLLQGN